MELDTDLMKENEKGLQLFLKPVKGDQVVFSTNLRIGSTRYLPPGTQHLAVNLTRKLFTRQVMQKFEPVGATAALQTADTHGSKMIVPQWHHGTITQRALKKGYKEIVETNP